MIERERGTFLEPKGGSTVVMSWTEEVIFAIEIRIRNNYVINK